MIQSARGILKGGLQILCVKVGHFYKNLLGVEPGSKKVQYVDHSYAHPANTRAASTLLGIYRYSVE
jgi:hypothetical protein